MEWQEILNQFYKDRNDYSKIRSDRPDVEATIDAVRLMLIKLASNEEKERLYEPPKPNEPKIRCFMAKMTDEQYQIMLTFISDNCQEYNAMEMD